MPGQPRLLQNDRTSDVRSIHIWHDQTLQIVAELAYRSCSYICATGPRYQYADGSNQAAPLLCFSNDGRNDSPSTLHQVVMETELQLEITGRWLALSDTSWWRIAPSFGCVQVSLWIIVQYNLSPDEVGRQSRSIDQPKGSSPSPKRRRAHQAALQISDRKGKRTC